MGGKRREITESKFMHVCKVHVCMEKFMYACKRVYVKQELKCGLIIFIHTYSFRSVEMKRVIHTHMHIYIQFSVSKLAVEEEEWELSVERSEMVCM